MVPHVTSNAAWWVTSPTFSVGTEKMRCGDTVVPWAGTQPECAVLGSYCRNGLLEAKNPIRSYEKGKQTSWINSVPSRTRVTLHHLTLAMFNLPAWMLLMMAETLTCRQKSRKKLSFFGRLN